MVMEPLTKKNHIYEDNSLNFLCMNNKTRGVLPIPRFVILLKQMLI